MSSIEDGEQEEPPAVKIGTGNIVMIVMGPVYILDERAAAALRGHAFKVTPDADSPLGPTEGDDVS